MGFKDDVRRRAAELQAGRGAMLAKKADIDVTGALVVAESHDEGRNAVVVLFPDRITRTRPRKIGSLVRTHQDMEVTPIKAVSSAQVERDGILRSKVTVYASGNTIVFRLGHDDAHALAAEIMRLITDGAGQPATNSHDTATGDLAAQLTQLAELHRSGALSDTEYEAAKAQVLRR